MANAGDVLDMAPLGCRVQLIRTAAETDGELLEFDVSAGRAGSSSRRTSTRPGRAPRGDRGRDAVVDRGREHVLGPGETIVGPAPARRTASCPAGTRDGHVRVAAAPALAHARSFLERLAELDRDGQINRCGFPKPVAGARLVLDFGDEGTRARPPLRVQRALARRVLRVAGLSAASTSSSTSGTSARRARRSSTRSPTRRTYPEWWGRSTSTVEADGPPRSARSRGSTSRAGCRTTCTRARAIVAARAAAPRRRRGRRRPARARHLDADADAATAARTSASTGRCSPTASCCARSRPSCARSSAGTTTGRSPARWRAWSPTRSAPPEWRRGYFAYIASICRGVLLVDRLALELHRRRQLVAAGQPVALDDREAS